MHFELRRFVLAPLQDLLLDELVTLLFDDEADPFGTPFGGDPDHLRLGDAG